MRLELDAPEAPNLASHGGARHEFDDLLSGFTAAPLAGGGTPLMLPVDDVDEDPHQPRTEFDPEALRELADSILQRGVLQAISVRPHPENPARWMVKIGARRLRACRLAGKREIPAFIDAVPDGYAQVIENEHREGLTLLELAQFVQKRLAAGDNQAAIARQLGKGRPYLTHVVAMIDAPEWLLSLYLTGKCRGIRELYELRRLHDLHGEQVEEWLRSREIVSRVDIAALQARLRCQAQDEPPPAALASSSPTPTPQGLPGVSAAASPTRDGGVAYNAAIRAVASERQVATAREHGSDQSSRQVTLRADCNGVDVCVWLNPLPAKFGQVLVSVDDAQLRKAVAIDSLRALRLQQQDA